MFGNVAGYCLNTSTIQSCGLSLQEKIELAARVGYDAIELWVDDIETYLKGAGTLPQLRTILNENAIKVPNLIAFFEWASLMHRNGKKRSKKQYRCSR